jgi:hypothetical protein
MRKFVDQPTTRKALVEIECDCCHTKFTHDAPFDGVTDSFDKNTFILQWEEGTVYPEGGSTTRTTVELCHVCRKVLLEKLKREGFMSDVLPVEVDW